MEWMLMPLKRYADFSGRSRRKEFWMFTLLQAIVYVALFVLMAIGGAMSNDGKPGALAILALVVMGLFALATLVPVIAVSVRRFHDQGKSGWFYLLSFVPFGGLIVTVFMCLQGQAGPNQYGPDPKQG